MSKKVEWYKEFIDFDYKPKKDEIVALYYFEPNGDIKIDDAIGRIASESSIGTWTTLETLESRVYELRGRAFWQEGHFLKVSYPLDLWEIGNIPQLLSGIAGNIFGMKALKNLRLIDAHLPPAYLKGNKGPIIGKRSIKQIFQKKGPLTATVPKPKVGMTVDQHVKIAKEAWSGGIDCIKDDENLTSQSFNNFELRVKKMAKMRDKIENETNQKKDAFINVTAETEVMKKRIKLLHDYSFNFCMIDVVTCGFSALQTIRNYIEDLEIGIHAHRAMHATFTKHNTHGISMLFLAKLLRLIGVDNLHIGTVVGKLDSPEQDVLAMKELLLEQNVEEIKNKRLAQSWNQIEGVLPVASGGLHPGVLPEVLKIYDTTDLIIQVGGGIHGHPDGTKAGSIATIAAIEAYQENITLEEKAKTNIELKNAMKKWGYLKPV